MREPPPAPMISRPDTASRDTPVPAGAYGKEHHHGGPPGSSAALKATAWTLTSDLPPPPRLSVLLPVHPSGYLMRGRENPLGQMRSPGGAGDVTDPDLWPHGPEVP